MTKKIQVSHNFLIEEILRKKKKNSVMIKRRGVRMDKAFFRKSNPYIRVCA